MNKYKKNIAIFLAALFHISGTIGILFTDYKKWFIANTPLNLLLMLVLFWWVQEEKTTKFYSYSVVCFVVGMGTEMIGVNTGYIFGNYQYGSVMGIKWMGVPFLIGVTWVTVMLCCGNIMQQLYQWVENRADGQLDMKTNNWQKIAVLFDAALLAVSFDWLMEPVAVKLGFWQWQNGVIPNYNYLCWFVISFALQWLYRKMDFKKPNQFSHHLLVIQTLFFLTLRINL